MMDNLNSQTPVASHKGLWRTGIVTCTGGKWRPHSIHGGRYCLKTATHKHTSILNVHGRWRQ